MQYEAKTPEAYITNLENDWRKEKLLEVREIILNNQPDLIESIEYKMLGFGNSEKRIFHLNAQKGYVSLYVGNIEKIENGPALLAEFNLGKGCIRIKKTNDLSNSNLESFIKAVLLKWSKGGNTDC